MRIVAPSAKAGVVTLTGEPILDGHQVLLPVALRLIWDIDSVVDVVDKIGLPAPPASRRLSATT